MKPIDLSIIILAYGEADIIAGSLSVLADWLDTHNYGTVEVIVVAAEDKGDTTVEQANTMAGRFKHFSVIAPGARVGKGRDVKLGMLSAKGRYRLFMDGDLATPLNHLDDVAKIMKSGQAVGIAVRDLMAIHPDFKRKVISGIGNILTQAILLPGIKDTQCGFKVFRGDVAQAAFERLTIMGWGFDFEVLAITRSLGYTITTFDAPDWNDPKDLQSGLSNDSAVGVAIKTLKELFHVRLNLLQRHYR